MPKICILTPTPDDEAYQSRWRDVLAVEVTALRQAGAEVEGHAWTEADDLSGFDLVMPLLVWGYHRQSEDWLERVARWSGEGVRLANPASVLGWNGDKTYLGRLSERGAPVVPTVYVDKVDEAALANAAASFGTARVVAKPIASSTAWRTIRWPGGRIEDGPAGAAMIQPYLPSIETAGEVSLLFFGGRFSHAIRKVPQPGEFRVQPEFDGIIGRYDPAADERDATHAILAAVEEELVYARIDLVRGLGGRPELIELELIEPDLYLGYDSGAGARFAEAVLSAAR